MGWSFTILSDLQEIKQNKFGCQLKSQEPIKFRFKQHKSIFSFVIIYTLLDYGTNKPPFERSCRRSKHQEDDGTDVEVEQLGGVRGEVGAQRFAHHHQPAGPRNYREGLLLRRSTWMDPKTKKRQIRNIKNILKIKNNNKNNNSYFLLFFKF